MQVSNMLYLGGNSSQNASNLIATLGFALNSEYSNVASFATAIGTLQLLEAAQDGIISTAQGAAVSISSFCVRLFFVMWTVSHRIGLGNIFLPRDRDLTSLVCGAKY